MTLVRLLSEGNDDFRQKGMIEIGTTDIAFRITLQVPHVTTMCLLGYAFMISSHEDFS